MKREQAGVIVRCRWAAAAASGAAAMLALIGWLVLGPATLRAEPYMAVREGYKCSQCHVNKTGGGARNDYATLYMQTRMAAGPGVGTESGSGRETDPGQFHTGSGVAVGADLRASFLYSNFHGSPATNQVGRPTSCDSCHATTTNGAGEGGGGKIAEAFIRYQPVPNVATIVFSGSLVPTTMRDFYGLVERLPMEGYVKAGTFKLPNGLQNNWDFPFQHTTQGGYQGLVGFETVYATGLEVGIEPGPFTIALSATNPDNLTRSPTEKRYFFTASAVSRLGLIGVNYAQDPVSITETRTLTSGFIGTNLGRFTVLGQLDQMDDKDNLAAITTTQQARLGEIDYLIKRGHNIKYVLEARDPDLAKPHGTRDRQSLIYEPFLTPYVQCRVGYRIYDGPSHTDRGEQWFVEGHFLF